MIIKKQLVSGAIGTIFFFHSNTIFANDTYTTQPEITPERLEKTVIRQFDYIDKRLLNDLTTQKIMDSRNAEAIQALERAKESRNRISKQIADRKFDEALVEMRELNNSINKAIKISRASDKAVKKIKDEMESAHIINDTYFSLAKKRGIDKGNAGEEAQKLVKEATILRTKAEKDFKAATEGFHASTKLLKKAVAAARKQGSRSEETME